MIDQGYIVSELDRRLTQLIRLGTIAEVDVEYAKVKVKLGENQTGWRPWLTTAGRLKTWNPPVVGEQVVVLSPGKASCFRRCTTRSLPLPLRTNMS